MAQRTKQQIKEDNAKLLEKKNRALVKLNTHLNEVADLSEEDQDKVNDFINMFLRCETVYKTLYPEMKKLQADEKIDVKKLNFNVQKFEAALRFFGITFDHEKINRMFAAKKSYLTCRNNILHGLKIDSINEVLAHYDEMVASMNDFLENVANGQPE